MTLFWWLKYLSDLHFLRRHKWPYICRLIRTDIFDTDTQFKLFNTSNSSQNFRTFYTSILNLYVIYTAFYVTVRERRERPSRFLICSHIA